MLYLSVGTMQRQKQIDGPSNPTKLYFRPLSDREKKQGSYKIVDVCGDKREIQIRERALAAATPKTFTYDKVFGPQTKQIEVYKTVVVPVLEEVLLGYNCTIFA